MRAYIKLCYEADYEDARTRANLARWYLPAMRQELDELAKARKVCERDPNLDRDWLDAGMLGLERRIAEAVRFAEMTVAHFERLQAAGGGHARMH